MFTHGYNQDEKEVLNLKRWVMVHKKDKTTKLGLMMFQHSLNL